MTNQKFYLHLNRDEQEILQLLESYRSKDEKIVHIINLPGHFLAKDYAKEIYEERQRQTKMTKAIDIIIITEPN